MLDVNRLFPAESAARSVATKLYETVRDLPILSPHGHTDPAGSPRTRAFPNPAALFIQPDHYIFRMLYSQGVSLESLGIPQVDGSTEADPREVWRIFAKHYYLFRGTPTRLWLDYTFENQFGLTGTAERRERRRVLRHHREEARDARVPSARSLREVQDRGALHHRLAARYARAPQGDSRNRDGREECFRPSVRIRSSTPSTSAFSRTSKSWVRSPARTSGPSRAI